MSEQAILVLGLAGLVAALIVVIRLLPSLRPRRVDASGWAPGVYLLSSEGCDNCAAARARMEARGADFSEIVWQQHPALFQQLGIDAVPSVVAVEEGGGGRWWRGAVPRQIPGIGPRPG
jgi:hypothetical protein